MNRTRALCDFLAQMDAARIGEDNLTDIRYKLLDWLGCAIAAQGRPCERAVRGFMLRQGGAPHSSAVGIANKVASQQAAFYNGFISHALEYDDTNKIAITHPGAPVLAAALAAAEECGANFETFACGVAAGYEAMIRLGAAVNPDHYEYWHTTGTCGAFAAAATVARIMGLDGEKTETAMGIVSTMASGLVYVFGTDAKLVTVGNAARCGLEAAQLAQAGLSAPKDAFAADKGYARAARAKEDLSFMVPAAGDRLLLEDAYYKLHASCGHTHSALDALMALMRENAFCPEDVLSVRVEVYQKAYELCARYQTENETRAKFSLPFCIAVMLQRGRCTLSEFSVGLLADEGIREYAQRITIVEEPSFTYNYPQLRTERVTLCLRDGRTISRQVDLPLGRPPRDVLESKFYSLTEPIVPGAQARAVYDAVMQIKLNEPLDRIGDAIRQVET